MSKTGLEGRPLTLPQEPELLPLRSVFNSVAVTPPGSRRRAGGIGTGVLLLRSLVLLGAEAQWCKNHDLPASRNHFQSLVTTGRQF